MAESLLLEQLRCEETRREAFSVLVERYGERLYWHIRKLVLLHDDADDVLQNTFVKAWENVAKFRGEAQLFTWLFRIATNEALTFLHHTRRLQRLSLGDARQLLDNLRATDAHFCATDAQQKLQAAILTLPEKQRMVFNMRYFDEMPYEQMSDLLGVSVGALKASYHIAEKKIKKLL
ncbi:MAG: sigma-70 family RNA polymerase sigma factor [Prevotellaceae bacterium]|nr:sigma-70 family RNA polymerase sigma factor [Prevotellaceae bacterium]